MGRDVLRESKGSHAELDGACSGDRPLMVHRHGRQQGERGPDSFRVIDGVATRGVTTLVQVDSLQ